MKVKHISTSFAVFCHTLAMFIFAYGYFDAGEKLFRDNESVTLKLSENDGIKGDVNYIESFCKKEHRPEPFERFVFILIDALRADFIPTLRNNTRLYKDVMMPYLEKLLQNGQALGMISQAETPTVTMPRIKALLSGIRPNFLDLVLNLNAAKFGEDNLIEKAVGAGKRIVFYGDDTWLQMFERKLFIRSNITLSFFAPDYTTVDTNVTDNLIPELDRISDWDYMVLHYLGVDHIGHAHGGARSHLIPKKLLEMDSVIQRVYTSLKGKDSRALIVITGDHGMTDAGNHGGGTSEETDTAMIFLTTDDMSLEPSFSKSEVVVKQIDLASTLSALLNIDIPNRNQGKAIIPILRKLGYSDSSIACHLYQNLMQICNISNRQCTPTELRSILFLHKEFIKGKPDASPRKLIDNYVKLIYERQTLDGNHAYKNSMSATILGIGASFASVSFIVMIHWDNKIFQHLFNNCFLAVLLASIAMDIFLLGSTSFIEMEGHYWNYVASSLLVILLVHVLVTPKKPASNVTDFKENGRAFLVGKILLALLFQRIAAQWNSAESEANISFFYQGKDNIRYISASIIFVLIMLAFFLSKREFGTEQAMFISGLFWTYLYKSDIGYWTPLNFSLFRSSSFGFISSIGKARIVHIHVALILGNMFIRKYKSIISFLNHRVTKSISGRTSKLANFFRALRLSWVLLSILLVKPHNVPLIAMNVFLEHLLFSFIQDLPFIESVPSLALLYMIFAANAFYTMGNSNSISTINVESGYVGLTSDDAFVLVYLLVIFSTYSMYLYWFIMLMTRLEQLTTSTTKQRSLDAFSLSGLVIIIVRLLTVTFYMFVAVLLKNHLFIWTVICPKFLYEGFITLLTHVLVGITLSCLYIIK